MSEPVEKKLTSMLNEETWTRAAIGNYSIADFQNLDTIISDAKKEGKLDEISDICKEHLVRSKNSIIALYLSSMILLMNQDLDDSNLVSLIEIFTENKRMQIVEHLCLRVLSIGESKLALRTLADIYKKDDNDKLYEILEKLTKVDYDDAEAPKKIAERAQSSGDNEKAVEYYKKAVYRFINMRKLSGVKEVWSKLTALIPDEIEFFYRVQDKVATSLGESKNTFLMYDLYQYYAQKENWDVAIEILKLMLHYDSDDTKARADIVDMYRKKYASHSHLEEYIKVSNLNQSWRPIFEAIDEFEKHIAFDTGSYVFHKTWGVGRINNLDDELLTVDFTRRRGHQMSLKMALSSLQTLSPEHIWVLKATKNKDELVAKIKEDPEWALKIIITSFDNACDLKKIKAELVPSLLTQGEWTSWNTKARKILKESSTFGINPDNVDSYSVREHPMSVEEKLYNEFKAQKNFFNRIEILNTFMEQGDVNDEMFHDMFGYFDGFLRAPAQTTEQVLASYLLVSSIAAKVPHLQSNIKQINFVDLYRKIADPIEIYNALTDKDLKQRFLKKIRQLLPNWHEEYIKLFPTVLSIDIIDALVEAGYVADLQNFVADCFENDRVFREPVIWFFKNVTDQEWFKELGIDYEKQLIALIHILDISLREIENKQRTTENRRLVKQVTSLLFGESLLEKFIDTSDKDTVTRVYILIADIKDLDSALKAQLRTQIQKRFPDFNFFGAEEKQATALGLIVTARMLEEKKKELQNILEVRIPQNQKDLGYAISLGDLRENSEYKAAREEQAKLSNLSARLQSDLERAEVFDPLTVSTKKIGFGTTVCLQNTANDEEEKYTILGPWESDPENGIISYLSPLGHALMNKKVSETVDVKVGDDVTKYKVLEIGVAQIK